MGLDAVVYRNAAALVRTYGEDALLTDPVTGEAYTNATSSLKLPRDVTVAESRRLGNIAEIGHIRDLLARRTGDGHGQESVVANIVSSGSHAGDVITLEELPQLDRELIQLEAENLPELKPFVESLRALVSVARQEASPIVFV
ncbi:MAG TPA: hypothetical protein VKQ32_01330 [Polyangia bacterium]|nr:hypothetical protein [Polyangia bacterium]